MVFFFQVGRGVDCIKRESSPLPCSSPVSLHKVTQTQQHPSPPPHQQQHPTSPSSQRTSPQSQTRKLCSPDTSTPRHPELELSTTDSDTDSVNSLGNHSECCGISAYLLNFYIGWVVVFCNVQIETMTLVLFF